MIIKSIITIGVAALYSLIHILVVGLLFDILNINEQHFYLILLAMVFIISQAILILLAALSILKDDRHLNRYLWSKVLLMSFISFGWVGIIAFFLSQNKPFIKTSIPQIMMSIMCFINSWFWITLFLFVVILQFITDINDVIIALRMIGSLLLLRFYTVYFDYLMIADIAQTNSIEYLTLRDYLSGFSNYYTKEYVSRFNTSK